jgi:hypothetical protein
VMPMWTLQPWFEQYRVELNYAWQYRTFYSQLENLDLNKLIHQDHSYSCDSFEHQNPSETTICQPKVPSFIKPTECHIHLGIQKGVAFALKLRILSFFFLFFFFFGNNKKKTGKKKRNCTRF